MPKGTNLDPSWMTVQQFAKKVGMNVDDIFSLAEEGKLTFSVLYSNISRDAFRPEYRGNPPKYWNLTSSQVVEIRNNGSIFAEPSHTLKGAVNNNDEIINTVDSAGWRIVAPTKLEVQLNSLRILHIEIRKLTSGVVSMNSPRGNIAVSGAPKKAHTYLIKYFINKYPEATWKNSEPNFQNWLSKQIGTNEYEVDGEVVSIEIELAEYRDAYEFSLNGKESETVNLNTIQERFKKLKKGMQLL